MAIRRFNIIMYHLWKAIEQRCFNKYVFKGVGVGISHQALVIGRSGISIGNYTHILPFAVIHCGPWSSNRLSESKDYPDHLIIGNYCTIQPFAFISTCGGWIEIGDNCSVNPFCVLYGYGGLKIGNNVRIANGVSIVPQNHKVLPGTGSILESTIEAHGIVIHDNVWLGSRVVVLDGVEIGKGAIIGAGAVVTKSIPEGGIAVGVPARVIRSR